MDSAVAQSIDDGLFVRLGETDAESIWRRDHRTLDQRRLRGQKFRRVVRVQPITRRLIELAPGRALAIDDDIHAERIDPRLRERNVEAIRLEEIGSAQV